MERRKEDKSLETLWTEYNKALQQDRVQKTAGILEEIKVKALEEKASWDYYLACRNYVNVKSRHDWKLRESLQEQMRNEILAYDEPLLTYLMERESLGGEELLALVAEKKGMLVERHNKEVYEARGSVLNDAVVPLIQNDYEYVLWDMFKLCMYGWSGRDLRENVYALLSDQLADGYPKAGIAEFFYVKRIVPERERKNKLESLARRYDGQALAMLPVHALLEIEFRENADAGTSEYFLDLKRRLESYENERKSYRGELEKLMVGDFHGFEEMLDQLENKSAIVMVRDGEAELMLRNLDKVRVKISRDGEAVYEQVLVNPSKNFYVRDSLSLELPVLDDGDYRVICYDGKDDIGGCYYSKYTLSVASRTDADGFGVYVADYLSGKPVEKVDMALYKGDRLVAEASGVELNGFTPLPREISSRYADDSSGHRLVCSCVGENGEIRRSQEVYLYPDRSFDVKETSSAYAAVMLDRAAFTPGETVKFKAVLYECLPDGTMQVMPAEQAVAVRLNDISLDVLAEKELKTNEFGSVAGEFVLDGIKRNGYHFISIHIGNKRLGSAELTVDEFVLPTFEVTFEKSEKVFLPGEVIEVRGKVSSFSGHSISSSAMVAKVTLGDKLVKEEKLEVGPDGIFMVEFADVSSDKDSYLPYEIEVKVTDLTGETSSFRNRQYVMRSPVVSVGLKNKADGSFCLSGKDKSAGQILADEIAHVSFGVSYPGGGSGPLSSVPVKFALYKGDSIVSEGETMSGATVDIDFGGLTSGLYKLAAEVALKGARGEDIKGKKELFIVKVRDDDERIDGDFENMFRVIDEGVPGLQIGAGSGPVWAVVELYGNHGQRLKTEILYLDKGEMAELRYDYEVEYPDALVLNVLYFRDSKCHTYSHTWERQHKEMSLPLEFVRFEDVSAPGSSCSVVLKTGTGSEALVSVFDVSTEQIRKNHWPIIRKRQTYVDYVHMNGRAGVNGSGYNDLFADAFAGPEVEYNVAVAYGAKNSKMRALRTRNDASEEESLPFQLVEETSENVIREDFSTTLAFEPFLCPSEDGTVKLDFTASDKISTFVVSAFVHDKSMNNSVVRRDMLLTLPVTVSVVQPQYLYENDIYQLKASLSNNTGADIRGVVKCMVSEDGKNDAGMSLDDMEVVVPAGGAVSVPFEITVPEGVAELGFKVVFEGSAYSDGVFVTVPVYPASQVLTETHSAVLLHGMSEEETIRSLREKFVNVSSIGAECSVVSIMDMLRESLPLTVEAKGKDVVLQSESMYVNLLAGGLRASQGEAVRAYVDAAMEAASKILACANADGGFGWFEGMKSSPVVTAVVLGRFAGMRDRGLLNAVSDELGEDVLDSFDEAVVSAVKYLDSVYFGDPDRPSWYGHISLWQYLEVRSRFVGVPFDEASARKAAGMKKYNEFKKAVKGYLVPKNGERWTEGAVLSKVRMIRVIDALESSPQGRNLAASWGISSGSKLRKSLKTELESLKEYAVAHRSGGVYYPNAVLPFRGLLESEAYAHAMICDLYKDLADGEMGKGLEDLADGIRLWIMLQKETQQWSSDPGFVEALASVYDGSDAVKDTRVIMLSKKFYKPFNEIKATGNGFKVSAAYYIEETAVGESGKLRMISDGDTLHVGDKIIAEYSVWSKENRNFVRLSAPRPACFRPEMQLSGWCGGFLRPLSYGLYSVSPYAYREVKADRTLYWIDVFPEEKSVIKETLFVTQEGSFTSPVTEIESLYAPHYRANSSFFRFR